MKYSGDMMGRAAKGHKSAGLSQFLTALERKGIAVKDRGGS